MEVVTCGQCLSNMVAHRMQNCSRIRKDLTGSAEGEGTIVP